MNYSAEMKHSEEVRLKTKQKLKCYLNGIKRSGDQVRFRSSLKIYAIGVEMTIRSMAWHDT